MGIRRATARVLTRLVERRSLPLEAWPASRLLWLARWIADPRPLGRFPGWHFGVGYESQDPAVRLRERVWKHFVAMKSERSFKMPWYRGLNIWLYLGNDQSWAMFVGGCYEPNEFAFLDTILRPGMTFVDVGANDGLYAVFAARRVARYGTVLAVEPSLREARRLRRNIALNRLRNVTVAQVAAGDRLGDTILHVAGYGHEGHNTLGAFIYETTTLARTETVSMLPLDEVAQDTGLGRVDVIKIDVEGAEWAVLQGARGILGRDHPLLLLELCDSALLHQGKTSRDTLDLLRGFGYHTYVFDRATGRPVAGEIPPEEDPVIVAVAGAVRLDT